MQKKPVGFAIVVALVAAIMWIGFALTGYPTALDGKRYRRPPMLIENIRLISMATGRPQVEENCAVLIADGTIRAIGCAGEQLRAPSVNPASLTVIDGEGKTILPGFIDAHVHLWDEAELGAYLAYGVTSIRNLSGMPFHLPLAQRIADGKILGPDLVTTGPILNSPGPNFQDNHQAVTNTAEARAAVRAQHRRGYRTLKVYSNLTRDAYEAILEEARKLDMAIVGHTPEGVREHGVPREKPFNISLDELLDDGFKTFEHIETIVWHGLRDELDPQKMRALAEAIAAAGVTVTPTRITHKSLVRVAETKGAYLDRPGVETLNPLIVRLNADYNEFWKNADASIYEYEATRDKFHERATGMLHKAGVPLITGTDAGVFTLPGASMTRELELLVEAGLTPYEALQAATVIAGPATGLPDRGQIAPGFKANMVLVSNDPLIDVSIVEHPAAVMIGGVWLDEKALADLKGASRQGSTPRTARRLFNAWIAQR